MDIEQTPADLLHHSTYAYSARRKNAAHTPQEK